MNAPDPTADAPAPDPLGSFARMFVVKGCPDPFLSILWPLDELQAHLPEGFVAAEATDAIFGLTTPFWAPTRVEGDATPMGMIVVGTVLCQGADDPHTHYQEVITAIAIDAPAVPDLYSPASIDLYTIEHVNPTPWFADLMAPTGWNFTADAELEGQIDEDLSPSGTARWTDEAGTGYSIELTAPPGPPVFQIKDLLVRSWQVVPEGLAFYDHYIGHGTGVIPTEVSCTMREDTTLYGLTGGTRCDPEWHYAPFITYSHDPAVSFHYLAGATVA